MKMADFDVHAGRFMSEMADIMATKNPDYSTEEDDAMSNYYEIARIAGVTPRQVWLVLFSKHLTAIMTWAQGRDLQSETVAHRFVDMANYAVLGAALAKDMEGRPKHVGEVTVDLNLKDCKEVADLLEKANFTIQRLERELAIAREQNLKMDKLRKAGVAEIRLQEKGHVYVDDKGNMIDPEKFSSIAEQANPFEGKMTIARGEDDDGPENQVEEDDDPMESTTMSIEDVFSELLEIAADIPTTIAQKSDPKRIFLTDSLYEVVSKLENLSRFSVVRTLTKFLHRSGITQSQKFQPFVEQIQSGVLRDAVVKFETENK